MNVVWPRQGVVYREGRWREVSLFQLRLRAAAQQREMCHLPPLPLPAARSGSKHIKRKWKFNYFVPICTTFCAASSCSCFFMIISTLRAAFALFGLAVVVVNEVNVASSVAQLNMHATCRWAPNCIFQLARKCKKKKKKKIILINFASRKLLRVLSQAINLATSQAVRQNSREAFAQFVYGAQP